MAIYSCCIIVHVKLLVKYEDSFWKLPKSLKCLRKVGCERRLLRNKWYKKYFVIQCNEKRNFSDSPKYYSSNERVQYQASLLQKISVMKKYNVKRHYCKKHAAEFDGIEGQLRFDKIEKFKKSLSMQKVFHAHEKDKVLTTKLSFEIFEVIAKKGKAYSDGEFTKNCLEVFPRKKCLVK